jgi:lantibiotic biosynthesis dehydratase-like protein
MEPGGVDTTGAARPDKSEGCLMRPDVLPDAVADPSGHDDNRHAPVRVAPYAMIRLATVPYWSPAPDQDSFRRLMRSWISCEERIRALAPEVGDDLYRTVDRYDNDFHRRVVLPIRRDVHNGRTPRPALLAAAARLRADVPSLDHWLGTLDRRASLRAELAAAAHAGLAADRAAVIEQLTAEPLRRAVALSSTSLLHGLDRAVAARTEPDKQTRQAEAKILRYALRASTKTSPWSWFAAVGWGLWDEDADAATPADAVGAVAPNHMLISALLRAVERDPAVREHLRYRGAPAPHTDPRLAYCRREVFQLQQDFISVREEELRIPRTATLDLVGELVAGHGGTSLAALVAGLLDRLPPTPDAAARITTYLHRLVDEQFLVPVSPIDPHTVNPLPEFATWLDTAGRADVAELLRTADRHTREYDRLPAGARPRTITALERTWDAAFGAVGATRPNMCPVKEDSILPGRRGVGRLAGADVRDDLVRLAPLTELFDTAAVMRGLVRHRLVRRYGPGGRCRVADLVEDGTKLWSAAYGFRRDGTIALADEEVPPQLAALAAARREVTAAVHALEPTGDDIVLPEELVRHVADLVPDWLRRRAASYSYFVQPATVGTRVRWCVNAISDGWGRFTSRFLRYFDGELRDAVAGQICATLRGKRVVQFRPARGFNANLHPLLVTDEVGEDRAWAGLTPDELELAHDRDTDTVRLRVIATGEPVDVLYLGFMFQPTLPDRTAPLYLDLGAHHVVLQHLTPATAVSWAGHVIHRQPRLRYRDLVLTRRTWTMPEEAVSQLAAELAQETPVPAGTAARWAAAVGLPEAMFLTGTRRDLVITEKAVRDYVPSPKPQFVDLGSALHLRCLHKLLTKQQAAVRIEEALPRPGAEGHTLELIAETYRPEGR